MQDSSDRSCTILVRFNCRNPNSAATSDLVTWPEYTLDRKEYLLFGENRSFASRNMFGARTSFWLELEPRLHVLTQLHPDATYSFPNVPIIVG